VGLYATLTLWRVTDGTWDRYFGRAKELPGVKEMFTRGGGSLTSCREVERLTETSSSGFRRFSEELFFPDVPESRTWVLW